MKIAMLGMGRMGRAFAGRLLEGGHELIIWNRTKGKAAEVISAGARQADKIAEATAPAEVILTSLANDDAVRAVALGPQGVHPSIGPGAIYVGRFPRRGVHGRPRGGQTDDQLRELPGDSPMVAPGIKNRFEGVLTGGPQPWWSIQLGAKDARLAVDTAKDVGVNLPLTRVVHDILAGAASAGTSDDDISATARCYRADQATAGV
jgi:3-hydroxyisobutyrate dehydrogenase-like beta-hydroxyacid dehydrogenase